MRLRIILVGTTHSGNIGSVARAMKTFALSDLYLVAPKIMPDEQSKALASNAKDVLYGAIITDTLEQAIKNCDRVVGTSTRKRNIDSIYRPLREGMQSISKTYETVAIVFGRENSGLTNKEMDLCDEQIYIPSSPDYPSLNLAQAVQVVTYEWGLNNLSTATEKSKKPDFVTHREFQGMLAHCQEVLLSVGFMNKDEPRLLMRRLKHLFNRTNLDKKEINIIRGFFTAVQKKIR